MRNGVGKTTTVRILATLLAPDAGQARVLGHDVVREAAAVRGRVALTGQFATVDDDLTGRENLVLLGRLAGLARRAAKERAAELLAAFGLEKSAARQVKAFSGGMRRRLDLAASIIVRADLFFLDEPTTGLDPASRAQVWEIIRSIVADGATVLLTTQYLDEADELADRIAVINHGTVIAEGTGELKASAGSGTLRIRLADPAQRPDAGRLLTRFLDVAVQAGAGADGQDPGRPVSAADERTGGLRGYRPCPVLCQNSLVGADLAFRARYAALRYSLIRPLRTCLRSIRAVTSMAFPGWRCGGSCCRLWCGRWPL